MGFAQLARDRDLLDALHERGHATERRAGVGVVQLIRRTSEQGKSAWQAHSDSRKGGQPAGY
jgi:gamma-glutamyltranspeptidase